MIRLTLGSRMRSGCRLVVVAVLSSLLGCASFTAQIPRAATVEQRSALAGSTLACAGEAQRNAILLGFLSGAAGSASSVVGTFAAAAQNESERAVLSVGAFGLGVLSLGASVAAVVMQWSAAEYTEQAGQVLAGQTMVGGCSSQPTPRVSTPAPRARKRAPRPDGTVGGRCYGNGTCDEGLFCSAGRCHRPKAGVKNGPCYNNGTCNDGYVCNEDSKCVIEAAAPEPGVADAQPAAEDIRVEEGERPGRRVLSGE